jgi:hypothetical protein
MPSQYYKDIWHTSMNAPFPAAHICVKLKVPYKLAVAAFKENCA